MIPNLSLKPNARILITRTDRIGDLVISSPVFLALREKYPEAWIAALTFQEHRELLDGNPNVNEVLLYDKGGSEKGVWGNFCFSRTLAKKNFDVVIHLHATNRMHWIGWLAQIPIRIGYRRKCSWALTHSIEDKKKEGLRHEAEYNFDLLKFVGVPIPGELKTFFPLKPRAKLSLEELLANHKVPRDKPWIVIHPSASCPSKVWPAERYGVLCNTLAEKYQAAFILIGAIKDRDKIAKVKRDAKVPLYDLSGRLTLGMLGHLLAQAELLISTDSGPTHIADAVNTPVIAIFGRKQSGLSPTRWRPLGKQHQVIWKDVGCETCLAHNCQIHFLCLDAISTEDVLEKVAI